VLRHAGALLGKVYVSPPCRDTFWRRCTAGSGPVCCDGHVQQPDDDPRAVLDRELGRVATRLRGLSLERLQRADAHGVTPASRTHDCAQHLADLAADAVGRDRRPVPVLAAHASADQLTVTAHDVLDEGDDSAVAAAAAALTGLRRVL
jgi:hypothetical protein